MAAYLHVYHLVSSLLPNYKYILSQRTQTQLRMFRIMEPVSVFPIFALSFFKKNRTTLGVKSHILSFTYAHSNTMVDSSQLMLPAFYALVLGEEKKSLDLYLKAIKNILKNESLTQISPRIHDAKEIPKETLGLAFDAVSSFIRGGTFDQSEKNIHQYRRPFILKYRYRLCSRSLQFI